MLIETKFNIGDILYFYDLPHRKHKERDFRIVQCLVIGINIDATTKFVDDEKISRVTECMTSYDISPKLTYLDEFSITLGSDRLFYSIQELKDHVMKMIDLEIENERS